MKIKRSQWGAIMVGVVVLTIVALVWSSGGFREMFNPSTDSFAKGSSSVNCPSGAISQPDGTCAGPCPAGATQSTDSSGYVQCTTQNASGGSSGGPAPKVPALSCSGGSILFEGACYQPCSAGKILQDDGRNGVICTPGSSTTPAPASSSSTQPMMLPVPSPCRPQYKSIPGGSMEFKCFS